MCSPYFQVTKETCYISLLGSWRNRNPADMLDVESQQSRKVAALYMYCDSNGTDHIKLRMNSFTNALGPLHPKTCGFNT